MASIEAEIRNRMFATAPCLDLPDMGQLPHPPNTERCRDRDGSVRVWGVGYVVVSGTLERVLEFFYKFGSSCGESDIWLATIEGEPCRPPRYIGHDDLGMRRLPTDAPGWRVVAWIEW